MLPKVHKELAKDSPVVLLNEVSSSGVISRTSMAHSDPQGSMQQTSARGCDHKGKGTHGIIARKLLADKENWRVPENESDWQFLKTSCRGQDQY